MGSSIRAYLMLEDLYMGTFERLRNGRIRTKALWVRQMIDGIHPNKVPVGRVVQNIDPLSDERSGEAVKLQFGRGERGSVNSRDRPLVNHFVILRCPERWGLLGALFCIVLACHEKSAGAKITLRVFAIDGVWNYS